MIILLDGGSADQFHFTSTNIYVDIVIIYPCMYICY